MLTNTPFSLLLLLVVKLVVYIKTDSVGPCTIETDFAPVKENCAQFYRCSNGVYHKLWCAPGTLFDYKRKLCDYPGNVICFASVRTSLRYSKTHLPSETIQKHLDANFRQKLMFLKNIPIVINAHQYNKEIIKQKLKNYYKQYNYVPKRITSTQLNSTSTNFIIGEFLSTNSVQLAKLFKKSDEHQTFAFTNIPDSDYETSALNKIQLSANTTEGTSTPLKIKMKPTNSSLDNQDNLIDKVSIHLSKTPMFNSTAQHLDSDIFSTTSPKSTVLNQTALRQNNTEKIIIKTTTGQTTKTIISGTAKQLTTFELKNIENSKATKKVFYQEDSVKKFDSSQSTKIKSTTTVPILNEIKNDQITTSTYFENKTNENTLNKLFTKIKLSNATTRKNYIYFSTNNNTSIILTTSTLASSNPSSTTNPTSLVSTTTTHSTSTTSSPSTLSTTPSSIVSTTTFASTLSTTPSSIVSTTTFASSLSTTPFSTVFKNLSTIVSSTPLPTTISISSRTAFIVTTTKTNPFNNKIKPTYINNRSKTLSKVVSKNKTTLLKNKPSQIASVKKSNASQFKLTSVSKFLAENSTKQTSKISKPFLKEILNSKKTKNKSLNKLAQNPVKTTPAAKKTLQPGKANSKKEGFTKSTKTSITINKKTKPVTPSVRVTKVNILPKTNKVLLKEAFKKNTSNNEHVSRTSPIISEEMTIIEKNPSKNEHEMLLSQYAQSQKSLQVPSKIVNSNYIENDNKTLFREKKTSTYPKNLDDTIKEVIFKGIQSMFSSSASNSISSSRQTRIYSLIFSLSLVIWTI